FLVDDDEITKKLNEKELLSLYPNANKKMIELSPKDIGYKSICHMLLFKKSHQKLWSILEQEIKH
ncbi:alpha/beta hydrolase, partial [Acinetobacter baumannii]|nr:alpha/beta hydrolase [Acinetobacter baumannii]